MPPGFSGADLLRMIGSMVLVLALMGGLLYLLKRMQAKMGSQTPGRRLQVLESLSLNTRHKVALLSVDGHKVLVGMSPGQLTHLAHWPDEGNATKPGASKTFDLQALTGDNHAA